MRCHTNVIHGVSPGRRKRTVALAGRISLEFGRGMYCERRRPDTSGAEPEHQIEPVDWVIPTCSQDTLEKSLQHAGVTFDLPNAIKRHSLASLSGAARERADKVATIVRPRSKASRVRDTVFATRRCSDTHWWHWNSCTEHIKIQDRSEFSSYRSNYTEPTVELREQNTVPELVRDGISKGKEVTRPVPHNIEIIRVCLNWMPLGLRPDTRSGLSEASENIKYRGIRAAQLLRNSHTLLS